MTKDELKKEAEEGFKHIKYPTYDKDIYIQAYFASAEPREKQIQIDAEQIRALQKQNGELTDELKTLRESIKDYGAGCYENGLRNGKRKLDEQLTKAKEHIENLLYYVKQCTCERSNYAEIEEDIKGAEQFLNSEVEK
jgi:hypothetical protein